MSGNVSKEGITADLEWMHRVGIGGMQMFDGDLGVARYLETPVIWMTPEWKDAFRHAGAEGDRIGLEMSMAASGGWSETAGPWVTPEAAMPQPPSRQIPQLPTGDLSYSEDGQSWTKLISLPDSPQYARTFGVRTFTFAPVSARYFRLTLERVQLTADQILRGTSAMKSYRIAEIALNFSPRIAFFEDAGCFTVASQSATLCATKLGRRETDLYFGSLDVG